MGGGKPAARQGDMTRKGLDIVQGSAGVLIGAPTGVACSVCPTKKDSPNYGSPVNPLLGAKVLPVETDLALPGPLPFILFRAYSSYRTRTPAPVGVFGPGWKAPFDIRLQIRDEGLISVLQNFMSALLTGCVTAILQMIKTSSQLMEKRSGTLMTRVAAGERFMSLVRSQQCTVWSSDRSGRMRNLMRLQLSQEKFPLKELNNPEHDSYAMSEKSHGREEIRLHIVCDVPDELIDFTFEWKGLKKLCVAVSFRSIIAEQKKEPEMTVRYYISSADLTAEKFATAIRNHWHVENKLHWRLDVVMNEDDCKIRRGNAAELFSGIRHIAINILTNDKVFKAGLRRKMRKAAMDRNYLASVLAESGLS